MVVLLSWVYSGQVWRVSGYAAYSSVSLLFFYCINILSQCSCMTCFHFHMIITVAALSAVPSGSQFVRYSYNVLGIFPSAVALNL